MTAAMDLTGRLSECTSCHAEIVWAVSSTSGKNTPVNPKPDTVNGNVQLFVDRGTLMAGVLGKGQAAGARARGQELHTSHFVDCKNASFHRRRR